MHFPLIYWKIILLASVQWAPQLYPKMTLGRTWSLMTKLFDTYSMITGLHNYYRELNCIRLFYSKEFYSSLARKPLYLKCLLSVPLPLKQLPTQVLPLSRFPPIWPEKPAWPLTNWFVRGASADLAALLGSAQILYLAIGVEFENEQKAGVFHVLQICCEKLNHRKMCFTETIC